MEITQSSDKLEINKLGTYDFVVAVVASTIGFIFFGLALLSVLSALDGAIGLLFAIGGGFIAFGAEGRVTVLQYQQPCTITTRRLIGGKTLVQRFDATEVVKVEFIQSFTGRPVNMGGPRSQVYVALKNGYKLCVLERLAAKFPLGRNQPPTAEAAVIAKFLKVPLDTIDATNLRAGLNNLDRIIDIDRHDPTQVVLQQPTQEMLDKESKNT